jgi:hypothetical protein
MSPPFFGPHGGSGKSLDMLIWSEFVGLEDVFHFPDLQ